jgi:DNA polymerase I-like protein with 3'-5' exonuclease and polymerase domains
MRRLFFDLETDGLDPDVIHCIAVGEEGQPVWSYGPDEIKEGLEMLCKADELVAHNGLGYDFKVIEKLYPSWPFKGKRTDTLVLSRLIRADLKNEDFEYNWANDVMPKKFYGSHGLKAWGMRLQNRLNGDFLKGDYDGGWEHWSQAMQDYCEQDVRVTMALYNFLKPEKQTTEAVDLAHEISAIADDIGNAGWTFDEAKAGKLYAELCVRREELDHELQDLFEPWEVSETFIPKRNNKTLGYVEGVPFIKTKTVEFNHNSRRHIEFCLTKKYGWKPVKTTPQGHAIIDDVVLGSLDYPEAKKLSELFLIQKRIGQLAEGPQAWMKKVDSDGKLRHRIISPSTRTLRCTHIQPNLSQVPAVRLPYGKQCRELFTVPSGYSLVGSDLSGIEIRLFAHFLALYDEGEYAKVILESDIHSYNQKATGLATRDQAKTWLYATLYGAGDAKVGSIVGKGAKEGKRLKDNFIEAVPAYGLLKTNVEKAASKGFIKTLGSNRIKVNSSHTSLNSLLQSAGAVICSKWVSLISKAIKEKKLDCTIVGWIHDEVQIAVRKGQEEYVGDLARRCAKEAGEAYSLRIPIDAEYAVGRSWADTH